MLVGVSPCCCKDVLCIMDLRGRICDSLIFVIHLRGNYVHEVWFAYFGKDADFCGRLGAGCLFVVSISEA